MSVSTVTAELAARGIAVSLRSGKVVCRPASALTPELLDALKAVKADLLRLLPDVGTNPPPTGPRPTLDPSYWDSVGYPTASLMPIAEWTPCRCCRETRRWRRVGSATEWFCSRCAPPMALSSEIEVRGA